MARHSDLERPPEHYRLHSERRIGREPVIAAHPKHGPRTQPDTRNFIRQIKHARIALVGLLEDTVVRRGLERLGFAQLLPAVGLLPPPPPPPPPTHPPHPP